MAIADKPDQTSEPDTGPTESSPDDEMRRRFREALAHKHGAGPHGSAGQPGGKGAAPVSNEKRQRTFRRKSG